MRGRGLDQCDSDHEKALFSGMRFNAIPTLLTCEMELGRRTFLRFAEGGTAHAWSLHEA
jgi:hypothetical protein